MSKTHAGYFTPVDHLKDSPNFLSGVAYFIHKHYLIIDKRACRDAHPLQSEMVTSLSCRHLC
jgi:hypothetical protein